MIRKSNWEHGSSDSGPGHELFLHRDCPRAPAAYPLEFLGQCSRGGLRTSFFLLLRCQAFPSLIVAQSGGGDFFISSVDDSVLERSVTLAFPYSVTSALRS